MENSSPQDKEEKKIEKLESKIEERKAKLKKLRKSVSKKQKEYKTPESFTKRKVSLILNHAIIWVYLTYLLAFLGKVDIAENLSITVVKVIIYTFIPYLCKALFENVFKFGKFGFYKNNYVDEEVTVDENDSDNTEVTNSIINTDSVSEEDCAG